MHATILLEKNIHIDKIYTLPETNIAPENRPSQKETSIPTIHFQVLLLLVSRRVDCMRFYPNKYLQSQNQLMSKVWIVNLNALIE